MHRAVPRFLAAASAVALTAAIGLAPSPVAATSGGRVNVTPLIADRPGIAPITDPALVNPWGIAFGPTTPGWIADNGSDHTTVYIGGVDGSPATKLPLAPAIANGAPTGAVFNGGNGFVVTKDRDAGPAKFIFAGENGDVTGWAPKVAGGATTVLAAHFRDSVFKGLTMASVDGRTVLYVADFHNNRIIVLNDAWGVVDTHGMFTDPNLPEGYAPFDVQVLGERLYVTYAVQDADRHDEVDGAGLGILDVYTLHGSLIRRLVSHGALDGPWALVIAPSSFGDLAGALLVGNFGNGWINAYNRTTGAFLGSLKTASGAPVQIDGLWGLRVGNGVFGGTDELVYAAGSDHESHGQVGVITPLH